jgi:uncharacterized protein with HEPN domain
MKRHISILKHMLEDITDINEFTAGVDFDTFVYRSILKKSVCMSLINIGELAKALPKEFRSENNQIAWKNISGLRDITAHKYHTLNLDIIWSVVKNDIPTLESFIRLTLKKDTQTNDQR